MLRFRYAARSHRGLVRENNEDSGYASPALLVVADGVGGSAAGEVASASVAHVLASFAGQPDRSDDPIDVLNDAINFAYEHLSEGIELDPNRAGMATTLTAVLSDADGFALAHVGDSRAYLLRNGDLQQLTRDDTLVQDLIDAGDITPHEVASHPYRSVVVKSVTAESPPTAAIARLELQAGDRVLLCSDGLTDLVGAGPIGEVLADGSPNDAAMNLVTAALEAGGRDNVTCVVGDVIDGDPAAGAGMLVGAHSNPSNLINPVAGIARSA